MDNYNQSNLNLVPEGEPLRSEGTQEATGEEQSTSTSSCGIDDVAGSKPKGRPAADVFRNERKVRCCKELHTIGTWNVRTMNQGKLDVVKAEMSRLNINILGISELKWTGMGHLTSDEYQVYYCDHDTQRRNGVAIIVNKIWSKSVLGCNSKNDRMISIQFQGNPLNITLIQEYAPTTEAEEDEIEQFYADLQQLLDAAPKKDVIVIMGDWNAKVGSTTTSGITGNFGLGVRNEAGDRLVDFCQNNSMFIANTFFQQPKRRLYTWTSPGGQYRNQIDYILCNQRWRSSIKLSKTRPTADCGTEHELLLAKIQIKLKKTGKVVKQLKYDSANIPHQYTVNIKNRFDGLDLEDRLPEGLWTEIRGIIKEETTKNIPHQKKQKRAKWLSDDTLKVAEERRKEKSNNDRTTFSILNAKFQRMARRDKDIYMNQQCKEIEENNRKGRTRDLFKKVKEIKGNVQAKWSAIQDKHGNDLTEKEAIKKRWQEYTEELYKKDPIITAIYNSAVTEPKLDILESEIKWALDNIAKNKAPRVDEISIALLKVLKDDAAKVMLPLCQKIWRTKQWSKDSKRSIYIPIPKKGSAKDCSNYRTIALISHDSKIILKMIQARIQQYMDRELPDVQAGFRKGRGTRDQIANIRWIMEKN
ncbi:unnamed protein product [Adineta steineri]|uniref:Endonuclease/exonuclease/phosphatase domain-containing protein n=1 Tax=Adineta steineri TaxID=433720 RepID=A0A819TAB2_9BILA|nr:unnamed protein product [Adineta steineri]CAF4075032.1 unnamed protein product [Adineta steineri]